MKILLVNPPYMLFAGVNADMPDIHINTSLPLGLMYIGAMLEKAGHEVEILDALITDFKPYWEGDIKQLGMPWGNLKAEIRRRKPDIVGIRNSSSDQIDNVVRVARIVKEIDRAIPTVVGGPHASVRPTQLLQEAASIDIVVMGEGEYTMLDIMDWYSGKRALETLEGITYRKKDEVIRNQPRAFIANLDELPYPAYHLVDMERYLGLKKFKYPFLDCQIKRAISMVTSRGCPFNCVFCANAAHMGKSWRQHSPDNIINHIKYVVNTYGVQHIHFMDDNLTLNIKRFDNILDRILDEGIKISWDSLSGIRADRVTESLLKKMKQSGCIALRLGIESGDQYILDNVIDKRLSLEKVVETAKICHEIDLHLGGFYVIGLPGEKKENMEKTINFAIKLKKQYNVGINVYPAMPLYGTRLLDICERKGYLTQELTPRVFAGSSGCRGSTVIRTEDFTPKEVRKLVAKSIKTKEWLSVLHYLRRPRAGLSVVLGYSKRELVYNLKAFLGR